MLASFTSYSLEKRLSKTPQEFGKGAIEGVAAPESANNAAAQTSFIPLLTLGLPAHPVMALLVGAFIIQGITPGPNVINDEPELFWGLIASIWIGNVLLVMLNLPLIGLWVRMLSVPYERPLPRDHRLRVDRLLLPGPQPLGRLRDRRGRPARLLPDPLGLRGGAAAAGLRARPTPRGEPAPGDDHLPRRPRRCSSRRPISATLLALALVIVMAALLPSVRRKREVVFSGEDD